jgi:hypothetical protein
MILAIDAGMPVNGSEPPVDEPDPLLPVSPVPELPVEPELPLTAAVVEVVVVDAFVLGAAVVEVVEDVLVDVVELDDEVVVEAGWDVVVVDDEVVVVVASGSVVVVVVDAGAVVGVVVEGGAVVLVVDDVVVVVGVLPGGPGTADQTNPLGSEELAVKVISVFQLSVRAPEAFPLAQAMPTSHTPLPASSVASGILAAATAGPHSRFNGKVVTSPVTGAVLKGP